MKLRDVLKNEPLWKELYDCILQILDAGKQTGDGGMYFAGLRLSTIVTKLSNVDISEEKLKEPKK